MRIRDLPDPVTASKADWLPGTTWIGFTPTGKGIDAAAKCQATVNRQFGGGYVLERVTQSFEQPNPAYANDPKVKIDRKLHDELKDRLIAVHRLRPSARSLVDIIGKDEFEHLQDIWTKPGEKRRRWSVAFPVVETYHVVSQPRAKDVFAQEIFRRLYRSQSSVLRPLDDEARATIADLEIIPGEALNAWIAIEDEIAIAEKARVPVDIKAWIDRDLVGAMEGETEERKQKVRLRAAWLAHRFVMDRSKAGHLACDDCKFDPGKLPDSGRITARSCLDVHHLRPLEEGKRRTDIRDFALLCPTCHRIAHLRMKLGMN